MLKINKSDLNALYARIAAAQDLYLPVNAAGKTNFAAWEEAAQVDLLLHDEAHRLQARNPAGQAVGFRLIHVPAGGLLILQDVKQFTAFLIRHSQPQFYIVPFTVQCKHRNGQLIGTIFAEINVLKNHTAGTISGSCNAFFIAIADFPNASTEQAC